MEFVDKLALLLCIASVTGYFAAAILFSLKKKSAAIIAALAWTTNLGIFVKNWIINGYPPFASMYQVLSVLAAMSLMIYVLLVMNEKDKVWLAPYFCLAAAVPLVGTIFMDRQVTWSLAPALRSGWFVPHVCSYVLSYILATVAFILTCIYYLRKDKPARYEEAIYSILRISFPLMVTGLLFGALWAEEVWGNYWQWDVKEIWSLVTALLYSCYFHARKHSKTRKFALVFTVLGFAALIVTFLFVNVLPQTTDSFHNYA